MFCGMDHAVLEMIYDVKILWIIDKQSNPETKVEIYEREKKNSYKSYL